MSMPPPPPQGPSSYGAPYGGSREHPQGTLILILGILSIPCCGIILGPIALVMGNNAIAEIDRNPSAYSNRGTVQAGRICGIVGIALWVLSLIVRLAVL